MNERAQEREIQLIKNFPIDIEKEDPPKEKAIYLFHKHHSCSNHNHSPIKEEEKDHELWESDTYRFEFNISIFIKSLLISIVEILGLKILLFLGTWISGSKFLYNYYRLGTINGFINIFGWINMALVIYSIYEKNFIYTDAISLSYMAGLFFVSIVGASKMSFINSKIAPLLETVELSKMSCIKVSDREIFYAENELPRTILRLNLDASSLFMSFLEDIPEEEKSLFCLTKSQRVHDGAPNPTDKTQATFKNRRDRLILRRPVSKPNLIEEAVKFEDVIFYYKFLTEPEQWDTTGKIYGYLYLDNVLGNERPEYPYARFLFVVGLIGTIVVSFMKLDDSEDISGNLDFIMKYIVKGTLLLLNASVTVAILYFISQGTEMIWNRLCFVKGLTELISEESSSQDNLFKTWDSMINIFDFESLRTWASLRMIIMNLSQKRLEAISLAISVIFAVQLTIISVLGFFYFTSEDLARKAFFLKYIIFFGTPTVIYMIYALLFIYVGSQVNNQYQEHIYLLKSLKITINKLYSFYPTYAGNSGIQPSTYLFARGLRYLQRSLEGQEVTPALLKDNLETLNNAYDTIITELELAEKFHPLTLLGIPMTESFVGTVFTTILTVLLVPVSKYVSKITGWD